MTEPQRTPRADTAEVVPARVGGTPNLLDRLNNRGIRLLLLLDAAAVFGAGVLVMLVRFGVIWPTIRRGCASCRSRSPR